MNVVIFTIRFRRRYFSLKYWKNRNNSISSLIDRDIRSSYSVTMTDTNYISTLNSIYNNLPQENMKVLLPQETLIGKLEIENINFFLFKSNNDFDSKYNCTINVLAYAETEIENIINSSYGFIKKVFKRVVPIISLKNNLFLYPFDKEANDICSIDLKIRTDINTEKYYESRDWIRIGCIVILFLTSLALYFETQDNEWHIIYRTVLISSAFFIIIDFLFYFITPSYIFPLFRRRKKYRINIKNLESAIQGNPIPTFQEEPDLVNPSTE